MSDLFNPQVYDDLIRRGLIQVPNEETKETGEALKFLRYKLGHMSRSSMVQWLVRVGISEVTLPESDTLDITKELLTAAESGHLVPGVCQLVARIYDAARVQSSHIEDIPYSEPFDGSKVSSKRIVLDTGRILLIGFVIDSDAFTTIYCPNKDEDFVMGVHLSIKPIPHDDTPGVSVMYSQGVDYLELARSIRKAFLEEGNNDS